MRRKYFLCSSKSQSNIMLLIAGFLNKIICIYIFMNHKIILLLINSKSDVSRICRGQLYICSVCVCQVFLSAADFSCVPILSLPSFPLCRFCPCRVFLSDNFAPAEFSPLPSFPLWPVFLSPAFDPAECSSLPNLYLPSFPLCRISTCRDFLSADVASATRSSLPNL